MARLGTIPPKYDDEIMQLVADGYSVNEIQNILLFNHKLDIRPQAVQHKIMILKQHNAEIARAALSQQVVQTTINHTKIFEKDIMKLEEVITKCFDEGDNKVASLLLGNKLRIQQQHLSLLGLDKPISDDDDILKKLAGK